jgi:hypothetical protein
MIMRHWILCSMSVVALIGAGVGRAGDLNIRIILAGEIVPGVYGQVDLGDEAPPPLFYAAPVLIVPVATPLPPVYLYVPPDHVRYWHRYCHQYNACSRPVYFVRPPEYAPNYVRRYYNDGYYYRGDDSDDRREEHHRRHHHDDDHEHDENDDD